MGLRTFLVRLLFPTNAGRVPKCPCRRGLVPLVRRSTGVKRVIKVTRLNGEEFYVNSDLIEFIEKTPDTVLTLTTGRKIIVKEDVPEIVKRVTGFRQSVAQASLEESPHQVADAGKGNHRKSQAGV